MGRGDWADNWIGLDLGIFYESKQEEFEVSVQGMGTWCFVFPVGETRVCLQGSVPSSQTQTTGMAAQLGSLLAAPQGGAGVAGTCLGWRLWRTSKYLEFYSLGIKRSKSRISLSSKERWTQDLPNTFTCDNQALEQLKSLDRTLDLKGLNENFKPCNWELNEWGKPKGTHVTDHAALGIVLVQEWSSGHWWLNFNSRDLCWEMLQHTQTFTQILWLTSVDVIH